MESNRHRIARTPRKGSKEKMCENSTGKRKKKMACTPELGGVARPRIRGGTEKKLGIMRNVGRKYVPIRERELGKAG